MVENESMDQLIGNYSLSFTILIWHNQNTAEDIVGQGHAFKTPGKVCLKINGEWEVR